MYIFITIYGLKICVLLAIFVNLHPNLSYMWHFLLILPPFAAFVWAAFQLHGYKVRERRMLLAGIGVSLLIYFSIQDVLDQRGVYPFIGAKFLHDLAATSILPCTHLFICYFVGADFNKAVARLTFLLMLLMVPDFVCMLSNPSVQQAIDRQEMYNYLTLNMVPGHTLKLQMYVVVLIIQLGIEVLSVLRLRQMLKQRNLYLNSRSRLGVNLSICFCVWVLLTLLPSHEFYANRIANALMLSSYSLLLTLMAVGIVAFFNTAFIVDSENKPVDMSHDLDSRLGEDIRLLMERERIYLNPVLRIEELASMLSTNRTYVTRAFRLKFNSTFTEVVNRYRIEHAKELMRQDRRKRIDEVARESGFGSANFFGRVFKNAEGVTPTQWRNGERAPLLKDDDQESAGDAEDSRPENQEK